MEGERVALVDGVARLARDYVILVEVPCPYSGDECLPDSRGVGARNQRMRGGIPTVEITHHRDARGVGRPDGEIRALLPIGAAWLRVSSELLVGAHVRAFA